MRWEAWGEEGLDTFNAVKPDVDRLRGGFHLVKGVRATLDGGEDALRPAAVLW